MGAELPVQPLHPFRYTRYCGLMKEGTSLLCYPNSTGGASPGSNKKRGQFIVIPAHLNVTHAALALACLGPLGRGRGEGRGTSNQDKALYI